METTHSRRCEHGQASSEYAIVLTVILMAVAALFLFLSGAVADAIAAVAGVL
jgi:hypothetical protein